MKPVFETLLRKGIESAKLEAVFDGVDQHGHVILRDVRTKFGVEHHAWLNYRCTAMLPPVKRGIESSSGLTSSPIRRSMVAEASGWNALGKLGW